MKSLQENMINELRQNARTMIRELGLLNDAYFDIGVTLAERHLLIELSTCESPTMGEIAERLLLDKSTISRLISRALKKGYIHCNTDKKDKRKRFLQLTEFGKQTLERFETIAFDQTKNALSTLSQGQVETVYNGIRLYAKALKKARLSNREETKQDPLETLLEIEYALHQKGYNLRLFEKKDEEQLYPIYKEVVDSDIQFPYSSNDIDEFKKHFFPSSERDVYICQRQDGVIIGGFYIRQNYTGRSSHIANAAYMIHQEYRGQGIGSLLVKASLHLAKKNGFQAMQFNMVLSQNVLAIKLYERLGFIVAGALPNAVQNKDGSYQDGYVMFRSLEDVAI